MARNLITLSTASISVAVTSDVIEAQKRKNVTIGDATTAPKYAQSCKCKYTDNFGRQNRKSARIFTRGQKTGERHCSPAHHIAAQRIWFLDAQSINHPIQLMPPPHIPSPLHQQDPSPIASSESHPLPHSKSAALQPRSSLQVEPRVAP